MTKAEVTKLQNDLNGFTDRWLTNVAPLIVDGDRGHSTNSRIRACKFYIGYTGKPQRSSRLTKEFRERLEHPKGDGVPTAMQARGIDRRREQRRQAEEVHDGVAKFDGRPVAAWMKPYLEWARGHGWKGTLTSGFRTPEFSESLCIRMCGQPSCPGRCAGKSSNHSGKDKPAGAVDVSDFANFEQLMLKAPFTPKLVNNLDARDPVHFSVSGR